jgi:hypothetical protein
MNTKATTIADLICLEIKPEEKKRRKEKVKTLSSQLEFPENAKPAHKYECDVFNFLLDKKDSLGIQTVFKFENLRVDGAVLLVGGRRLAVEIKLRMNWKKALEAGYEFRRFLLSSEAQNNRVDGVIVFFEKFEGSGWQGQPKCRFLENGWNEWYRNHSKIEGHRADLFRLCQGAFEYYGLALANSMIANMEQLSEEDKNKAIAAANSPGAPSQG